MSSTDDIIETARLTSDLTIPRIVNGMWQVSGSHGYLDAHQGISEMATYHRAGLYAWDMADIYGPAESWYGRFRASDTMDSVAFTKFVPAPGPMPYEMVRDAIQRSARRMQTKKIDMVQFHWWDYADTRYLEAADNLMRLTLEGAISHVGMTNFDTVRIKEFVDRGIRIASNQVQYSILDTRPAVEMAPYCMKNGIGLLCYGTLLGGFMSAAYLGADEPYRHQLYTASLQKYKDIIDAWGGWGLFQDLLVALNRIATRHGSTIPCVAIRYVLDQPGVTAAIIGCRLGASQHISENIGVFGLHLDDSDRNEVVSVLARSRNLYDIIGDCGSEYR